MLFCFDFVGQSFATIVSPVCAQNVDAVCNLCVLGAYLLSGHRCQRVILVFVKRNPLHGRVDDLVAREQILLLHSLFFIGFMFVIGDGFRDVKFFTLTIHFLVLLKGLSQHFLFDECQLRVNSVHVHAVFNDSSAKVSILLLKLGWQGGHLLLLGLFFHQQRGTLLNLFALCRLESHELCLLLLFLHHSGLLVY